MLPYVLLVGINSITDPDHNKHIIFYPSGSWVTTLLIPRGSNTAPGRKILPPQRLLPSWATRTELCSRQLAQGPLPPGAHLANSLAILERGLQIVKDMNVNDQGLAKPPCSSCQSNIYVSLRFILKGQLHSIKHDKPPAIWTCRDRPGRWG